jgi:hypothetical protein
MTRPPAQRPRTAGYPRVIDQRPGDNGTVLVTFSLPGLRRAQLRVPLDAWLDHEHLRVHQHLSELADLLASYRPPGG